MTNGVVGKTMIMCLSDCTDYCLEVSGFDPKLKGVKQDFWVINGAWSAYYKDGIVTYKEGDKRHGSSHKVVVYEDIDDYGDYRKNIYEFKKTKRSSEWRIEL